MHAGIAGFGMVIFWIILIAIVALLALVLTKPSERRGSESGTSLDVLKKRYAAGEITRHEYEEIKRDLVRR